MVICTSDLHIQFSSTGTLWNVANVVVLLNDDGPVHKPGGFECGKLFTYKPMRLYMRVRLYSEISPCAYMRGNTGILLSRPMLKMEFAIFCLILVVVVLPVFYLYNIILCQGIIYFTFVV